MKVSQLLKKKQTIHSMQSFDISYQICIHHVDDVYQGKMFIFHGDF